MNPNGGRPRKEETAGNTRSYSAEHNSKPGILRRLAREGRTDLLDRFERGEITANQAAIQSSNGLATVANLCRKENT